MFILKYVVIIDVILDHANFQLLNVITSLLNWDVSKISPNFSSFFRFFSFLALKDPTLHDLRAEMVKMWKLSSFAIYMNNIKKILRTDFQQYRPKVATSLKSERLQISHLMIFCQMKWHYIQHHSLNFCQKSYVDISF